MIFEIDVEKFFEILPITIIISKCNVYRRKNAMYTHTRRGDIRFFDLVTMV